MNQSGRVNPVTILAIVAVALFAFVIIFSRESLATVGGRFMGALAKHDVETLVDMSYMGEGVSEEEMRKKWDFAVNEAGKYYRFHWRVLGANQQGEDRGAVRLEVIRNFESASSYEEKYQLPLIKVDGKWKVHVQGINPELFPALPR